MYCWITKSLGVVDIKWADSRFKVYSNPEIGAKWRSGLLEKVVRIQCDITCSKRVQSTFMTEFETLLILHCCRISAITIFPIIIYGVSLWICQCNFAVLHFSLPAVWMVDKGLRTDFLFKQLLKDLECRFQNTWRQTCLQKFVSVSFSKVERKRLVNIRVHSWNVPLKGHERFGDRKVLKLDDVPFLRL